MKRLLIYSAAMFLICSCGSDDEGTAPGGSGSGVGATTVTLQNTWLQENEITGGAANSTYAVTINKVGTREVKGTIATETELHEFYNVNYGTEYKLLDPKYYEIAGNGAFTIGADADPQSGEIVKLQIFGQNRLLQPFGVQFLRIQIMRKEQAAHKQKD